MPTIKIEQDEFVMTAVQRGYLDSYLAMAFPDLDPEDMAQLAVYVEPGATADDLPQIHATLFAYETLTADEFVARKEAGDSLGYFHVAGSNIVVTQRHRSGTYIDDGDPNTEATPLDTAQLRGFIQIVFGLAEIDAANVSNLTFNRDYGDPDTFAQCCYRKAMTGQEWLNAIAAGTAQPVIDEHEARTEV